MVLGGRTMRAEQRDFDRSKSASFKAEGPKETGQGGLGR